MRISDATRDRTAALLRRRCSEGYLSLDTFERRVEQVYRARTAAELGGLTADLPAIGLRARLAQWLAGRAGGAPALAAPDAIRLPLDLVTDRPLTVGRSRLCDLVLEHDTVSRRHAEIRRAGRGWQVRDLGSSNGTWVDGRRVREPAVVRRGQQLLLGGCLVLTV